MYRFVCYLTGVAILFTCGCGGPNLPYKVVLLAGTVTYQGNPVPGLPIFFMPEAGRPSNAFSDKDGKFSFVYTLEADGVQAGKGTFFVELSPTDGTKYNNRTVLDEIAKKYPKNNELLKVEITKKETKYELKLE
jgi:hypothetical protein